MHKKIALCLGLVTLTSNAVVVKNNTKALIVVHEIIYEDGRQTCQPCTLNAGGSWYDDDTSSLSITTIDKSYSIKLTNLEDDTVICFNKELTEIKAISDFYKQ